MRCDGAQAAAAVAATSGRAKPWTMAVPGAASAAPAAVVLLRGLALAWLLTGAAAAFAGLPAAYKPVVVEPSGPPDHQEFDLTPLLARARSEHKRLYVYLGARDCPFCRKYEAFLTKNAAELVLPFAPYIVVDLRSSLLVKADALFLRVGDRSLDYTAFQRSIGDERTRQLVYPSVWLLGEDAKPLLQMPAGTGTFETVAEQLEILRLEQ